MHLALYIPSLDGGGAERVMVALANGLVGNKCAVDLVLGEKKGNYFEDIRAEVNVVSLGQSSVSKSLFPLINYLRSKKPDALISALEHANLIALIAKFFLGGNIKIVPTVHVSPVMAAANADTLKDKLVHFLARRLYRYADAVVAVSEGVAKDLKNHYGLSDKSLKVIYNPVIDPRIAEKAGRDIDPNFFSFSDKEDGVVVAVGSLTKPKDYPTLIRAFSIVRRSKKIHLLILGEGEERNCLESLARELNLSGVVHMPGFTNNPFAYVKRSNLYVLSSAWEALPTVLIEALSLGVPVVATDCRCGPREILKDGSYGRLVDVGNPSNLAAAILESIEKPIQYVAMDAVERFSIDRSAIMYLVLLEELLHA